MSSATATKLPPAVMKQAKKSKELQESLIKGTLAPDTKAIEVVPIVSKKEEAAPPVTQAEEVVEKYKTDVKPKKVVAKADDKAVPPDATKAPEAKEESAEYWKHRFEVEKDLNKNVFKDKDRRIDELEEDKALTKELLANLSKTKPEPEIPVATEQTVVSTDIPETVIPEDEINTWGDEQYDFTRRVARAEITPLLNPILSRLAAIEAKASSIDDLADKVIRVATTQNNQVAQTYEEKLEVACPGWQNYAVKGGSYFDNFWNWAGATKHSKFSDETFDEKIKDAHDQKNASVVADIIGEFQEYAGHTSPAPAAQVVEDTVQPEIITAEPTGPSLEEQVTPMDAGGDTVVQNDGNKEARVFADSEIKQIYTDIGKGKYSDEDELKIKRAIARAYKTGNIDVNR